MLEQVWLPNTNTRRSLMKEKTKLKRRENGSPVVGTGFLLAYQTVFLKESENMETIA